MTLAVNKVAVKGENVVIEVEDMVEESKDANSASRCWVARVALVAVTGTLSPVVVRE